ncbi:hypothetical protein K432DRAFT_382957 [Lepidopterella palustris CBS 459.81]|uniref:EF hand domain-containing protein n=1 Tax=Lepidopterella palustris CBS 459.81 TaxID=1314670 RepID=A0A8E2JEM8_9PEZI|nr:hypothetical protein K432DRAFT_382957 [Lepidopterella palustris CBS 459.81]
MASSTTSSLSRHRPAILFLTGAAAAFTAYIIYNSFQGPPAGGLHRSNAIRRVRPRQRRNRSGSHTVAFVDVLQHIQNDPPDLGEVTFFGVEIALNPLHLISPTELRGIALRASPESDPEEINALIQQVYDTFLRRFLEVEFPQRPMLASERTAVMSWLEGRGPEPEVIFRNFTWHANRFSGQVDGVQDADGGGSVAGTEISWHTADDSTEENTVPGDGQTLRRTLYHIAEDRARQEGVIHRGVSCDGCDARPIRGIRWRCANCADFDLCSDCEATNSHTKTHIFYKIRIPAPYLGLPKQAPVYPGRPHMMSPSINGPLKKRLVSETKIEGEEIEALWDQFTCLADSEWRDDPNSIGWSIDRRSFNQAFIPRYSTFVSAPNLIYDRIFAYYDTNHDGKIGFEEFVKGLDGMHSRDPTVKLRIVFNGYDIDGDGFISRKDVLRIFRAYYAIEKEATRNYIADSTDELSVAGALDVINSGQPLGSAFTQSAIPPGARHRRLEEKTPDRFGDLRSQRNGAVTDDTEDIADRAEIIGNTGSRFEDEFDPVTGDPVPRPHDMQQEFIRERWQRRQFYVDEEEGMKEPEGFEEDVDSSDDEKQNDIAGEAPPTPDQPLTPNEPHNVTRGSRSSSRVRFQDDVDMDTRSNASTSSRPMGERWGGYEIPEPEKDLGKEVLYQITQQAFNELLSPLFREKEDLAMEASTTRAMRRKHRAVLDTLANEYEREVLNNKTVAFLGAYRYSRSMMYRMTVCLDTYRDYFETMRQGYLTRVGAQDQLRKILMAAESTIVNESNPLDDAFQPKPQEIWGAKLVRLQFFHEVQAALLDLFARAGWIPYENPDQKPPQRPKRSDLKPKNTQSSYESDGISPGQNLPLGIHQYLRQSPTRYDQSPSRGEASSSQDPTMPQFRPNSLAEILGTSSTNSEQPSSSPTEGLPGLINQESREDNPMDHHYGAEIHDWDDLEPPTRFQSCEASGQFFIQPNSLHTLSSQPEESPLLASPRPPTPIPAASRSILHSRPSPSDPHNTPKSDNDPVMYLFSLNVETLQLKATPGTPAPPTSSHPSDPSHIVEHQLRHAASDPTSPCHMAWLASLDAVDREITERKGAGLLDYSEFKDKVLREGRLRFLEAWMDWVSF